MHIFGRLQERRSTAHHGAGRRLPVRNTARRHPLALPAEVWRCWKEMRNRHIAPTPITLGCMVEAVVSNGDTEGAFDLIHTDFAK